MCVSLPRARHLSAPDGYLMASLIILQVYLTPEVKAEALIAKDCI